MSIQLPVVICLMSVMLCSEARAYEAKVATHTCEERSKADDTIVVTKVIDIPTHWDPRHDLSIIKLQEPKSGSFFQIDLVEHTVRLLRDLQKAPGVGPLLVYESMDPIHDGVSTGGPPNYSVRFKIYFSDDFTWVEASDASSLISPIRNTVYFVGASPSVIASEIARNCDSYNYVSSENLKSDIQKNYSSIYYPDQTAGMIDFSDLAKQLVNQLLSTQTLIYQ